MAAILSNMQLLRKPREPSKLFTINIHYQGGSVLYKSDLLMESGSSWWSINYLLAA
jgi:hypothetical protein